MSYHGPKSKNSIDYEARKNRFYNYDPNKNAPKDEDPILRQDRIFKEKQDLGKQYFTGRGPSGKR